MGGREALGDTELAAIFPLVSEALDPFPKWRGGKIKKPPLFPATRRPRCLVSEGNSLYRSCSQPDHGRNSSFRLRTGSRSHPSPQTWPKLQGQASVPLPWGRASPPTTGLCHAASGYDETPPGLHTAAVQGTLLPSARWHEGADVPPTHTCMACQVGHKVSSAQPAARPPCPEQQGRICPLHHGSRRRPAPVGLKRGQLHKHWGTCTGPPWAEKLP